MSLALAAFRLLSRAVPDRAPDRLIGRAASIGTATTRLDGPVKVCGTARFVSDIGLDAVTSAVLVRSTVSAGRIRDIDTTEAAAQPGVLVVMTYRNAPPMKPAPAMLSLKGAAMTKAPIMRDDLVRWYGEPVAVVVAETRSQAEEAARLVAITYDEGPAVLTFADRIAAAGLPKDVMGHPPQVRLGDVTQARLGADASVDREYTTPRYNHAAIELHAVAAHWTAPDRLELHDASQAIALTAATLATVFGLPSDHVTVTSPFVGGAFGNKMVWNHHILCAAAAKLIGRPVQLVLSRADVFHTIGGRTPSVQQVRLDARSDGTLKALEHHSVVATGMDGNGHPEQISLLARHLYVADSYLVDQRVLELNTVANTTMRAPGESLASFALESAVDELAHELALDPIDLRRTLEPTSDWAHRSTFSSRNLVAAYDLGSERFSWDSRARHPRSHRDGEWWVGHGFAAASYPYARFPANKASIRINVDGSAVVASSVHEMGMGTATVQTQHAADRLGLPMERITFIYGDSRLARGAPAGGSAQTVSTVAAVDAAATALKKRLLKLRVPAARLGGLRHREVELRDGGLFEIGGSRGASFEELLADAGLSHLEVDGTAGLPFELMKHSMHSFGAQFCEVRVSDVTGEVRVSRWTAAFDAGTILNPTTAASQLRGGIVMGIGMALTEECQFDERLGRVVNPSLAGYHVPVHADIPEIEICWTDIPDVLAPLGAKGVGEVGVVGVAAAIANAVFNATGVRVRHLPITPDKVLAGLDPC